MTRDYVRVLTILSHVTGLRVSVALLHVHSFCHRECIHLSLHGGIPQYRVSRYSIPQHTSTLVCFRNQWRKVPTPVKETMLCVKESHQGGIVWCCLNSRQKINLIFDGTAASRSASVWLPLPLMMRISLYLLVKKGLDDHNLQQSLV